MTGARVGIIGSGGREHELARAMDASEQVSTVIGLPGNPGFDLLEKGSTLNANVKDNYDLARAVIESEVDLVIVGPEAPLIAGVKAVILDRAKLYNRDIAVYGPSAAASIEGSKIDQRTLNGSLGIFQPEWQWFASPDNRLGPKVGAELYLRTKGAGNVAIKAEGEAAGKGALLIDDYHDARAAIRAMFSGAMFGEAGKRLIIESRGDGPEVSATYICDIKGNKVRLQFAQDNKRLHDSVAEGEINPNTGGMGATSPLVEGILTPELIREMDHGVDKTLSKLAEQGRPFDGTLYRGFMIVDHEGRKRPMHIEDNNRFGDPESQVIFPALDADVFELLNSAARGELSYRQEDIDRSIGRSALTVCVAAENYAVGKVASGDEIFGIKEAYSDDIFVHFGGVAEEDGKYYTSGGRVIYVTGYGPDAREKVYAAIGEQGIHFRGMQFRKKIGA